MSQHLITEFVNRTAIFKAFNGAKLVNKKVKKYQASNRKNNVSPEEFEESTHILQKIHVKNKKTVSEKEDDKDHIDVTV